MVIEIQNAIVVGRMALRIALDERNQIVKAIEQGRLDLLTSGCFAHDRSRQSKS